MASKSGKNSAGGSWSPAPRKKRKGVHSKAGTSRQKQSKNYSKKYRGQGRGK